MRIDLARIRADEFSHPAGLEQRGKPGLAVAGIVVDNGQVARALRDQRVNQLARDTGATESANQHGSAILHSGQRGLERIDDFVYHGVFSRTGRIAARAVQFNACRRNRRRCFNGIAEYQVRAFVRHTNKCLLCEHASWRRRKRQLRNAASACGTRYGGYPARQGRRRTSPPPPLRALARCPLYDNRRAGKGIFQRQMLSCRGHLR